MSQYYKQHTNVDLLQQYTNNHANTNDITTSLTNTFIRLLQQSQQQSQQTVNSTSHVSKQIHNNNNNNNQSHIAYTHIAQNEHTNDDIESDTEDATLSSSSSSSSSDLSSSSSSRRFCFVRLLVITLLCISCLFLLWNELSQYVLRLPKVLQLPHTLIPTNNYDVERMTRRMYFGEEEGEFDHFRHHHSHHHHHHHPHYEQDGSHPHRWYDIFKGEETNRDNENENDEDDDNMNNISIHNIMDNIPKSNRYLKLKLQNITRSSSSSSSSLPPSSPSFSSLLDSFLYLRLRQAWILNREKRKQMKEMYEGSDEIVLKGIRNLGDMNRVARGIIKLSLLGLFDSKSCDQLMKQQLGPSFSCPINHKQPATSFSPILDDIKTMNYTLELMGGSSSAGAVVTSALNFFHTFASHLRLLFPKTSIETRNMAVGATGMEYYAICMNQHTSSEADILMVETNMNDAQVMGKDYNMTVEQHEMMSRYASVYHPNTSLFIVYFTKPSCVSLELLHSPVHHLYNHTILSLPAALGCPPDRPNSALDWRAWDGVHPREIGHDVIRDMMIYYYDAIIVSILQSTWGQQINQTITALKNTYNKQNSSASSTTTPPSVSATNLTFNNPIHCSSSSLSSSQTSNLQDVTLNLDTESASLITTAPEESSFMDVRLPDHWQAMKYIIINDTIRNWMKQWKMEEMYDPSSAASVSSTKSSSSSSSSPPPPPPPTVPPLHFSDPSSFWYNQFFHCQTAVFPSYASHPLWPLDLIVDERAILEGEVFDPQLNQTLPVLKGSRAGEDAAWMFEEHGDWGNVNPNKKLGRFDKKLKWRVHENAGRRICFEVEVTARRPDNDAASASSSSSSSSESLFGNIAVSVFTDWDTGQANFTLMIPNNTTATTAATTTTAAAADEGEQQINNNNNNNNIIETNTRRHLLQQEAAGNVQTISDSVDSTEDSKRMRASADANRRKLRTRIGTKPKPPPNPPKVVETQVEQQDTKEKQTEGAGGGGEEEEVVAQAEDINQEHSSPVTFSPYTHLIPFAPHLYPPIVVDTYSNTHSHQHTFMLWKQVPKGKYVVCVSAVGEKKLEIVAIGTS